MTKTTDFMVSAGQSLFDPFSALYFTAVVTASSSARMLTGKSSFTRGVAKNVSWFHGTLHLFYMATG